MAARRAAHVLAQTPDRVRLAGAHDAGARLLAEAYGVADRLVGDGTPVEPGRGFAETVESLWADDDPPLSDSRGDDAVLEGHSVVLVTNIPAHYRVPLYTAVARRLEEAGARFHVLLLAETHPSRRWMNDAHQAYGHRYVRSLELPIGESHRFVPLDLESALWRLRPTLVLVGGFSPLVAGRTALVARARRAPLGIYSGETPATARGRGGHRSIDRRWLTRRAAFGVSYGSEAARYLDWLRPALPVVLARNAAPAPLPRAARDDDEVRILSVGRAYPGKRLDLLVRAFRTLDDASVRLTLVGDGPELAALRSLASGDARIEIRAAVSSNEARTVYRDHDVFAFPSAYDVWGLALGEAMAAGLAVATAPTPGAVADLVVGGTNGIVVEDGVAAWTDALRLLAADAAQRTSLGARAAQTVARRWTIEHSSDAFVAGLRLGALLARR